MRVPYAVMADDLTGAGDTGVQFAAAGLRSRALLGVWDANAVGETDVVVVNTESRPLPPDETYAAVADTAGRLNEAGVIPIYKKIDSTMRGNVGVMIEAVMDAFRLRLAVVCPAFPANGRLVVGGHLLVDGEPVARTAIGRDPVAPVRLSHIPSLLASQCRRPVLHVGLDTIDGGLDALRQALASPEEGALVVVDAVGETDLAMMVEAAFDVETATGSGNEQTRSGAGAVLFVGSAGLAAPLAERLARRPTAHTTGPSTTPDATRPIVVACGSVNPVSRKQLDEIVRSAQTQAVVLDVEAALRRGDAWEAWLAGLGRRLVEPSTGHTERTIVVATPGERSDVERAQRLGAELGLDAARVADRIATSLAEAVVRLMGKADVAGVIVTGGDIARALLSRLEAVGIDLHSEVLPGIPYGTLHGGTHAGFRIVTKAGGFGPPAAFVEAARYLANLPPAEIAPVTADAAAAVPTNRGGRG